MKTLSEYYTGAASFADMTAASPEYGALFQAQRDRAIVPADLLAGRPAVTVAEAAAALDVSAPTAGAAVERLLGAGLLREITGRGRDRVFVYLPAVAIAG